MESEQNQINFVPDIEYHYRTKVYLDDIAGLHLKVVPQENSDCPWEECKPFEEYQTDEFFTSLIDKMRTGLFSNIEVKENRLVLTSFDVEGDKAVKKEEEITFYCADKRNTYRKLTPNNYFYNHYYLEKNSTDTVPDNLKDYMNQLLDVRRLYENQVNNRIKELEVNRDKAMQEKRFEKGVYQEGEFDEFLAYAKKKKLEELKETHHNKTSMAFDISIFVCIASFLLSLLLSSIVGNWTVGLSLFVSLFGVGAVLLFSDKLSLKMEKELNNYMDELQLQNENMKELTASQEILFLVDEKTPEKKEEVNPLAMIRDTLQFLKDNHYDGAEEDQQKVYHLAVEYMNQKTGEKTNMPQMSLYDITTELKLTLTNLSTKLEEQQNSDNEVDSLYFEDITRIVEPPSLETGKEFVKLKLNGEK